jgi:hypothetical protein
MVQSKFHESLDILKIKEVDVDMHPAGCLLIACLGNMEQINQHIRDNKRIRTDGMESKTSTIVYRMQERMA